MNLSRVQAGLIAFGLGVTLATPGVASPLVNPLETTQPDPLLPRPPIARPLSPLEIGDLRRSLDVLQQQGETALQGGDTAAAFEIWTRELRLRRYLGVQEEVAALNRVGAIAWRENQFVLVRAITQRLQQIEAQAQRQSPIDTALLQTIAAGYQAVRAYDPAVALQTQHLTRARQTGDRPAEKTALLALAQLHLAWFNYAEAAAVYRDLLAIARNERDLIAEAEALQQLAYLYQRGNERERAIVAQQQLIDLYQRQQQPLLILPLKLAIGDNHRALNRPREAALQYQEAFVLARTTQQYGFAADALQRLATLYESLNRPADALVVYRLLLDVHQQTYDQLGVMNTFAQIGRIQRAEGNRGEAAIAFEQALKLSQQLNYPQRTDYFTTQLQELRQ